jgi:hypothetical protein
MIRMQAPRPYFEQWTRMANLYRADAQGVIENVDGRDIVDLRSGGCIEISVGQEDLAMVNEARVRLREPTITSPEEIAPSPSPSPSPAPSPQESIIYAQELEQQVVAEEQPTVQDEEAEVVPQPASASTRTRRG